MSRPIFSEVKEQTDVNEAHQLVTIGRMTLETVSEADSFEKKRNFLAIVGYPTADDEHELNIILRTLRKALYPGRTGGIY